MIQLLYFAWVREQLGRAGEDYPLGEPVPLAALLDALVERGGAYAAALHDRARLRFAVNQDMRGLDWIVRPGDEVAIFPPVTGG
jgi:molybdopterin synthase sulfur carrier subunit